MCLHLVSTPIGNLSDITLRALEVMKQADLILCEDTRHSQKLLNHYSIKKPTASYHKFNEQSQIERLIEKLQAGMNLCLIRS
jgi:16S rRNA (cytidine1402-2'-O)-methyltransferase